jgi:hypothetical protein
MERIENDGRINYKKTGGGSLHWNGKLIKPGQIIRLKPEDVPENFKDILIPMEPIIEKEQPPVFVVKSEYSLQPHGKSKSLWDVVDSQGKVINEKSLSKEVAQQLVSDLSR